jgi:hypothetical protein
MSNTDDAFALGLYNQLLNCLPLSLHFCTVLFVRVTKGKLMSLSLYTVFKWNNYFSSQCCIFSSLITPAFVYLETTLFNLRHYLTVLKYIISDSSILLDVLFYLTYVSLSYKNVRSAILDISAKVLLSVCLTLFFLNGRRRKKFD